LLKTEVRIDKRHEASAIGAGLLGFIGNKTLKFTDVENLLNSAPYGIYHPNQTDKSHESAYELWKNRI